MMMMPGLPEDVADDIVSRLPVKSLLRFRSVSKPWRSMIDSPYFVKLHLKRSIETRTDSSLLFKYLANDIVGFDSVDRFMESGNVVLQRLPSGCRFFVYPSCNGLFCVYWGDAVALWNPATREIRELPGFKTMEQDTNARDRYPDTYEIQYCWIFGLGYDCSTDDYKVVRFHLLSLDGGNWIFPNEVDVYSVKSNSWDNTVVDFPHITNVRPIGRRVLVNSALHCLLSEQGIIAFEFGLERFVLVPLPPPDSIQSLRRLENLGGCLSVFSCFDVGQVVDVWVMKDYGVKESWTKLTTITGRELEIDPGTPITRMMCSIACSNSGAGILFQYARNLLWFDLQRKSIKEITVSGCVYPLAYTETLVSPNVGGGVPGEGDIEELEGR